MEKKSLYNFAGLKKQFNNFLALGKKFLTESIKNKKIVKDIDQNPGHPFKSEEDHLHSLEVFGTIFVSEIQIFRYKFFISNSDIVKTFEKLSNFAGYHLRIEKQAIKEKLYIQTHLKNLEKAIYESSDKYDWIPKLEQLKKHFKNFSDVANLYLTISQEFENKENF